METNRPLVGTYTLQLENDGPVRRHYLDLAHGTKPGELWIRAQLDRSPGHEARAPGPDDSTHLTAGRGRLEAGTLRVTLRTGILVPEVLELELTSCGGSTAPACDGAPSRLHGTARRTRAGRTWTQPATVEPTDEPVTRGWPSFQALSDAQKSPGPPAAGDRGLLRPPPGFRGPSSSSSGFDDELKRRGTLGPRQGVPRDPRMQAPADPTAMAARMSAYEGVADAIIEELRSAPAGPAGSKSEGRFSDGLRRIIDAMPARFGPANAQLFGARDEKLRKLAQVLGLTAERQRALIEAFEVARAAAAQGPPSVTSPRALELAREFARVQPAPRASERYDLATARLVDGPDKAAWYVGFGRTPVRARVLLPDVVRVDRRTGAAAWFAHPEE